MAGHFHDVPMRRCTNCQGLLVAHARTTMHLDFSQVKLEREVLGFMKSVDVLL